MQRQCEWYLYNASQVLSALEWQSLRNIKKSNISMIGKRYLADTSLEGRSSQRLATEVAYFDRL